MTKGKLGTPVGQSGLHTAKNAMAMNINDEQVKALIDRDRALAERFVDYLIENPTTTYVEAVGIFGLEFTYPGPATSILLREILGDEADNASLDRYIARVNERWSDEETAAWRARGTISSGARPFEGDWAVYDLRTRLSEGEYAQMLAKSDNWKHTKGPHKGRYNLTKILDEVNMIFKQDRSYEVLSRYLSEKLTDKQKVKRIYTPWGDEETNHLIELVNNPEYQHENKEGSLNMDKIYGEMSALFSTNRTKVKISNKIQKLRKSGRLSSEPRQKSPVYWSDEEVELLTELYHDPNYRHSNTQKTKVTAIAEKLNSHFGTGRSTQSVNIKLISLRKKGSL